MKKFCLLFLYLNLTISNIYPSFKNILTDVTLTADPTLTTSSAGVDYETTKAVGTPTADGSPMSCVFSGICDKTITITQQSPQPQEVIKVSNTDISLPSGFGIAAFQSFGSSSIVTFSNILLNGKLNVPNGGIEFQFGGISNTSKKIQVTVTDVDGKNPINGNISIFATNMWTSIIQLQEGTFLISISMEEGIPASFNSTFFSIGVNAIPCVGTFSDAPHDILTVALINKYLSSPQPINPSLGCCN